MGKAYKWECVKGGGGKRGMCERGRGDYNNFRSPELESEGYVENALIR